MTQVTRSRPAGDANAPAGVELLVLLVVVGPVAVAMHELGHAAVAGYFGAKNIRIHIGRGMLWNFDGFVAFDPGRLSPFSPGVIFLAGPAASIVDGIAAASVAGHGGSLLHDLLYALSLSSWFGGVLSLVPMRVADSLNPAAPIAESDGFAILRLLGRAPAPRRRERTPFLHMGPVGWWAVIVLGAFVLVMFAAYASAEARLQGALVCAAIALVGIWGLRQTSR